MKAKPSDTIEKEAMNCISEGTNWSFKINNKEILNIFPKSSKNRMAITAKNKSERNIRSFFKRPLCMIRV